MTKDMAAEMIRRDLKLHHNGMSGEYRNALRMAAEALTWCGLTEEDFCELRDRFGEYVEFVVRDMASGNERRWEKVDG